MEQTPVILSLCSFTEKLSLSNTSYTLLYLLEGALDIRTNSELWSLHEGDIILLVPDDAAELLPNAVNKALLAEIDDTFVQRIMGTAAPVFLLNTAANRCDCSELEKMLHQMLVNLPKKETDSLIGTAYAYELLFVLKSKYLISSKEEHPLQSDIPRLTQIKHYMMLHYADPITLAGTAAHFNLTPAYFSRYFKRQFGTSFLKYLTDLRLRHAYRKLVTTDRDISVIALESGFSNLSGFYRSFRRTYDTTPMQLRASNPNTPAITMLSPADALPLMEAHSNSQIVSDQHSSVFAKLNVQRTTDYPQNWNKVLNAGYAMNCLKWDLQHQINEFTHQLHFHYIRVDSILTDHVTPLIQPGQYDFTYLERIITWILDSGCLPMLEFNDCQAWAIHSENSVLFQQTGLHLRKQQWLEKLAMLLEWLVMRWGNDTVSQWRFSLFAANAPQYSTDRTLRDEYCYLLAETKQLLSKIIPGAMLGAPGIADTMPIQDFGDLLTAIRETDGIPDYITIMHLPAYLEQTHTATERSIRLLYEGAEATQRMEQIRNIIADIFHKSKSVYIISANCEQLLGRTVSDSCHKAAWFTRTAISCNADALAYATFSDLQSARPNQQKTETILFGGHGIVTTNSIPKPLYYAIDMLHALGPKLVRRGENYMVTRHENGMLSIIMHNCKQFSQEYLLHPETVSLSDSYEDLRNLQLILLLEELQPGTYEMKTTILNEQHGSILHDLSLFGKSSALTPKDYAYLRGISVPQQQYRQIVCEKSFQLEAVLVPNEVRLVHLLPMDSNSRPPNGERL